MTTGVQMWVIELSGRSRISQWVPTPKEGVPTYHLAWKLHKTWFPIGLENLNNGKAFFSQGILNRLEKSEKSTKNAGKVREFQTNVICYYSDIKWTAYYLLKWIKFSLKNKTFKNTGKTLKKSVNCVSPEKWEPCENYENWVERFGGGGASKMCLCRSANTMEYFVKAFSVLRRNVRMCFFTNTTALHNIERLRLTFSFFHIFRLQSTLACSDI